MTSRDLGRWARPTLLGPFVTCWALATLATVTQTSALVRALFDVDTWAAAMLLVSFFAAAVAVCLVAVDVTLLRARFRRLPMGRPAWVGALLAPLAAGVFAVLLPLGETIPGQVLRLGAALVAGALSVRVLFGSRP